MKKKNGFTLIELLAVIIILGILMIIAIPSVTKYISDSRKSSYVDTAKEIVSGARNKVNDGKLGMFDTNATYYIPSSYIKTENASKSPYGEFTEAYIAVIYDGKGYKYYWISVDDAGQGVKNITPLDKLDEDDIESDLTSEMIKNIVEHTVIGNRNKILILDPSDETWKEPVGEITSHVSEEEGGGSSGGSESGNGGNSGGTTPSNIVCKPATTLHTKTCERASNGCGATIGNGNTITYGTLVNGSPKAGDAYDCKVTLDGDYTERFYYVGSEGNNSILIYYTNMNDQTMYAYDSSKQNWHGPRTGYQYLPSTSEWDNPGLIAPGTRQIVAENGSGSSGGNTIEPFTYTDKAARFLTSQELVNACSSISSVGSYTTGELDGCNWLMENIGYYEKNSGTRSYGYWLESPSSDNTNYVWYVRGNDRLVSNYHANDTTAGGVRPVITVLTSNIGQ